MARTTSALVFNLVASKGPSRPPAASAEAPEMPDEFTGDRASKWTEVTSFLRERGTLSPESGDLIRLYVIAFTEASMARAHVDLHGLIVPDVRTAAPIRNPYLAIARQAEHTTAKLALQLGLTPAGRKKGGKSNG